MALRVGSRHVQSRCGDVCRVNVRVGQIRSQCHGNRSRPRTHVNDPLSLEPARKLDRLFHQVLGLGPWNQHVAIDLKI